MGDNDGLLRCTELLVSVVAGADPVQHSELERVSATCIAPGPLIHTSVGTCDSVPISRTSTLNRRFGADPGTIFIATTPEPTPCPMLITPTSLAPMHCGEDEAIADTSLGPTTMAAATHIASATRAAGSLRRTLALLIESAPVCVRPRHAHLHCDDPRRIMRVCRYLTRRRCQQHHAITRSCVASTRHRAHRK